MSQDMNDLIEKLRLFTKAREWDQFHSPKNLACALTAEAGELLENFQWLTQEQSKGLSPEQKQAVAMEIADVLIYLVRLSDVLGIDPLAAAHEKIALNEKRYPVELSRGHNKKYTEL
jgi:NTP pyrophosphatase (non-canonical NTP hydrolase)